MRETSWRPEQSNFNWRWLLATVASRSASWVDGAMLFCWVVSSTAAYSSLHGDTQHSLSQWEDKDANGNCGSRSRTHRTAAARTVPAARCTLRDSFLDQSSQYIAGVQIYVLTRDSLCALTFLMSQRSTWCSFTGCFICVYSTFPKYIIKDTYFFMNDW